MKRKLCKSIIKTPLKLQEKQTKILFKVKNKYPVYIDGEIQDESSQYLDPASLENFQNTGVSRNSRNNNQVEFNADNMSLPNKSNMKIYSSYEDSGNTCKQGAKLKNILSNLPNFEIYK